jgi:hypothetical protein
LGRLDAAIRSSRLALLLDPLDPEATGVLHLLYRRLDRFGDNEAARRAVLRETLLLADRPGTFDMERYRARYGLALSNGKTGHHEQARAIWLGLLADPMVRDSMRQSVIIGTLRAALASNDRDLARQAFDLHAGEFPNGADFLAYGLLYQAAKEESGFWRSRDLLDSIIPFNIKEDLGGAEFARLNTKLVTEMGNRDDWAANYSSPGTISRRTPTSKPLTGDTPAVARFKRMLLEKAEIYLETKSKYLNPIMANGGRLAISRFVGLKVSKLAEEPTHIHSGSVLSGVHYPYIPASVSDRGRAGHIDFGRPDIDAAGPPPPLRTIQPETGLLLLFPAYLFHRILPGDFGEERFSIAFDFGSI